MRPRSLQPLLLFSLFDGKLFYFLEVACQEHGRAVHAGTGPGPTAAAPVAGQQLPFPGGLTFESQPARLDGRCTKRDRRQEDDEGGWKGKGKAGRLT